MRTPMNHLALGLTLLAQHDPKADPQIVDVPVDRNGNLVDAQDACKTLRAIAVTVNTLPTSMHNMLVRQLSFDSTAIDDGRTRYEFYPDLLCSPQRETLSYTEKNALLQ